MKLKKGKPVRKYVMPVLVLMILWVLSGCSGGAQPYASLTSTLSPTDQPDVIPTLRPSAVPTSAPSATLTPAPSPVVPSPSPSPVKSAGFTGTWTLFSNPNNIRSLALFNDHLWAATLGGVVDWDLKTDQSRLYSTIDGLAEIQANSIVYCPVTSDRLYAAHENGQISVYNFDMQKWDRVLIQFQEGQSLGSIQSLYCDAAQGRLYAAGKSSLGILDLKTGKWTYLGAKEGLHVSSIRAVGASGDTAWLAAGDEGAFMLLGSRVIPFNNLTGFPYGSISDVSLAQDGSPWFAYPSGLINFRNSDHTWRTYGTQSSAGLPFLHIDQVEAAPDGQIWISSDDEGICPYNPIAKLCSTIYPTVEGDVFTDLAVSQDGTAYAGTDGDGIYALMPDGVRHLLYPASIASSDIKGMAVDSRDQIWLAEDNGLQVFNPEDPATNWQMISPSVGGLLSDHISKIKALGNGLWFFYQDQTSASFLEGETWSQYGKDQGLQGQLRDVTVDRQGNKWFATDQGLYYAGSSASTTPTPTADGSTALPMMRPVGEGSGLPFDQIRLLLPYQDGVWVGTGRGLWFCQPDTCRVIVPDISVRSLAQDDTIGLLMGTDRGLMRYIDGQAFIWAINLGNHALTSLIIKSVFITPQHQIWAGSDGDGLFFFDGLYWYQFDTTSGFPSDNVQEIIMDHSGDIWISAVTGSGGGALIKSHP